MVEKKSSHLSWISGGEKPTESLTPSYTTEEKTSPAKGLKPWLWGKLARHTAAKTDPWSSEAPKTGANWREKSGKKNKFPTTEVAFGHPSICEQHLDKLDNTPLNLPFSISIPWHAEKTASWTSPTGSRNGWFAATAAQAKWMPFALQHHDMTEVEIQLHFMWLKDSKLPSFPLTVSISTLRKFNIALAKKKSKNLHLQDTSKADVPHFPTCLNVFSQVSLRCIDKHNVGNAIPHSHLGCGWGLKAASTSHRSRTWVLYTLVPMEFPKLDWFLGEKRRFLNGRAKSRIYPLQWRSLDLDQMADLYNSYSTNIGMHTRYARIDQFDWTGGPKTKRKPACVWWTACYMNALRYWCC